MIVIISEGLKQSIQKLLLNPHSGVPRKNTTVMFTPAFSQSNPI